jgi:hypothetical protein
MREACTPRREVADSPFDYAPLKNEGHAYYSYLQERLLEGAPMGMELSAPINRVCPAPRRG